MCHFIVTLDAAKFSANERAKGSDAYYGKHSFFLSRYLLGLIDGQTDGPMDRQVVTHKQVGVDVVPKIWSALFLCLELKQKFAEFLKTYAEKSEDKSDEVAEGKLSEAVFVCGQSIHFVKIVINIRYSQFPSNV